jgi:hypothetical protein
MNAAVEVEGDGAGVSAFELGRDRGSAHFEHVGAAGSVMWRSFRRCSAPAAALVVIARP